MVKQGKQEFPCKIVVGTKMGTERGQVRGVSLTSVDNNNDTIKRWTLRGY